MDVQIFHRLMCHSNAPANLRGTATGAGNLGAEVHKLLHRLNRVPMNNKIRDIMPKVAE